MYMSRLRLRRLFQEQECVVRLSKRGMSSCCSLLRPVTSTNGGSILHYTYFTELYESFPTSLFGRVSEGLVRVGEEEKVALSRKTCCRQTSCRVSTELNPKREKRKQQASQPMPKPSSIKVRRNLAMFFYSKWVDVENKKRGKRWTCAVSPRNEDEEQAFEGSVNQCENVLTGQEHQSFDMAHKCSSSQW